MNFTKKLFSRATRSARDGGLGSGGAPRFAIATQLRSGQWTPTMSPRWTLIAVVTLAACSSNSAAESQGFSAGDAAVPSGAVETTGPPRDEPSYSSTVASNSTTVPAPTGAPDSIQGTIPFTPIVASDPVGLDETSDFGTGLTVRIIAAEAADVVSEFPGDVGGPSVILTLELANSSGAPIDLSATTVDLSFGDAVPAVPLNGPPSDPVAASLASGASESATYVFSVPEDQLASLVVTVKYSADAPTAVFAGSLEP